MANDRNRENSYGGFQYRWNYDEYQKSLQRKRKKSAARGMRAFCLTTVFVFLLCTASLLIVLTASFMRSTVLSLPTVIQTDQDHDPVLPLNDSNAVPADAQSPASPGTPTTEPLSEETAPPVLNAENDIPPSNAISSAPEADRTADTEAVPAETAPSVLPGSFREEYSATDNKNLFTAMTLSEIAEACSVSAVTVQSKNEQTDTVGSGFFLTDDGYIVTNYHVIRDCDSYLILLYSGNTYEAQLVSTEPELDLALLKIDANTLPAVSVGSSANAAVGDQVVAISTPASSNFAGTVAYGYISDLDHSIEITDQNNNVISCMDMIGITASTHSGNAGGPLFNCFGEVIAINTVKQLPEGTESLGLAIPIDDVYPVLEARIRTHRAQSIPENNASDLAPIPEAEQSDAVSAPTADTTEETTPEVEIIIPDERPYAPFGVRCETVTEKESRLYKVPAGVILRHIEPDSYAEKNGLRIGDIILSVNGIAIPDVAALDAWAQSIRVGDTAELLIFRGGEEMSSHIIFADDTAITEPAAETEVTAEAELSDAP